METPADLDARIIKLISQVVPVKPEQIKRGDRLREDLGMDSVCSMELLSMLAEELDLDVGVEDAAGIRTVADTIALAARFLRAKAAA
ncbi:MAG: acyl carrier protein [Archangiaceae bacterium]|nr:acyl carrier protein [Archangiaceae bacterium]